MSLSAQRTNRFDELVNEGYELSPAQCIEEAFAIFAKYPWGFIGYTIVSFLIQQTVSIVPYIGTLAAYIIGPAMSIGVVIVAASIKKGERPYFGHFFHGFQRFGSLLLVSFLQSLFIVFGFVLLIIPGIYLAVAYCFVPMLVWFGFDGSYPQILECSRRVVTKRWFTFFGLFLLLILVNICGALCLLVGLLVTIPVSTIAIYVAFDQLFGSKSELETDIDNIQVQ